MSYLPREYWPERFARQGANYVNKGGRAHSAGTELEDYGAFLAANILPGDQVLDFGCGAGRFRPVIVEAGGLYSGVDLIEAAVEDLEGGAFLEGEELPFDSDSFDVVACIVVLQHIVDDAEYAAWTLELWRVLKPTGRLLVVDIRDQGQDWDEHMAPRGIGALSEAMGMTFHGFDMGEDHWCATMVAEKAAPAKTSSSTATAKPKAPAKPKKAPAKRKPKGKK